jgi:hypothetical protein
MLASDGWIETFDVNAVARKGNGGGSNQPALVDRRADE